MKPTPGPFKMGICQLAGEPTCLHRKRMEIPNDLRRDGKGTARTLMLCGNTMKFTGACYELNCCQFIVILDWKRAKTEY